VEDHLELVVGVAGVQLLEGADPVAEQGGDPRVEALGVDLDQDAAPVVGVGDAPGEALALRVIRPVTDAGASPVWRASSPAVSGPERSSRSRAFSSVALSPCRAATAVWNMTVATLEARPARARPSSSSARRPAGGRALSGTGGLVMVSSVAYI